MFDKQVFIHKKIQLNLLHGGGYVFWSRHAITKLVDLDLARQNVEQALLTCDMIEDYLLLHRPLPDCLVLGWFGDGCPIHAVIGIDEQNDRLFVITIYRPNPERWDHEYKTRRY